MKRLSALIRRWLLSTASVLISSFLATQSLAADKSDSPPSDRPVQPAQPPLGQGNPIGPGNDTDSPPQGGNNPPAGAANGGQTPPKSDAKTLTVDLSAPGDFVRGAGTYTLKYINKIPAASYITSSKIFNHSIPSPLDLPGATKAPPPTPSENSCASAMDRIRNNLIAVSCESEVAGLSAQLRGQLGTAGCNDTQIQQFGIEFAFQTESTEPDPLPPLADGDVLEITVKRDSFITTAGSLGTSCGTEFFTKSSDSSGRSGIGSRTLGKWSYSVGKIEAQWLTLYGFNFAFSGNQDYFSKINPGTSPTTYTITRKSSRGGKAFSPSVYFMRLPGEDGATWGRWAGWRDGDYFGGITAGLGFDFDNPTVFLGYGFGWGYNLMLTAGVVMHKENQLNGQYNGGDVISENLTSDQLTESTYKPQAYVGLAFRFGSNPFKTSNTDTNPKTDTTTPAK